MPRRFPRTQIFSATVTVGTDIDVAHVALRGELDLAGLAAVQRALDCAEVSGRHVVLDLRKLAFIDAGGVRAIRRATERMGDRVTVLAGHGEPARAFDLVGSRTRRQGVIRPRRMA
jgi:anti-anti-sigma factor